MSNQNIPNLELLQRFEAFLNEIPLSRYREELMPVKTVEQDLPKSLNPLKDLYDTYWIPSTSTFVDFETFFDQWWQTHREAIEDFRNQYFWGCTCEFVQQGFKARLYRTFVSVLTQFHFAYSWLAYCTMPIECSADLDIKGIDALVKHGDFQIALQIKKETYRREAAEGSRFARRGSPVHVVIEVPYTINSEEHWKTCALKAKRDDTKERYDLFCWLAAHLQKWLSNGFVVFTSTYPTLIEGFIKEKCTQKTTQEPKYLGWEQVLREIYDVYKKE
ncbi:MAG: TaqI family restriction endonuclease [Chthonomonadetes bacterium]|nr:TaqI family restriction endonuclease [Chthonomonadetes bacterium]